jgi:NAD(P)H-binding
MPVICMPMHCLQHFILITSLGTAKFGLPAGLLNLWWGVLKWKHGSERLLQSIGLPYTIVRPGGMERPTDDYENTHNVRLSKEDTMWGGQVKTSSRSDAMTPGVNCAAWAKHVDACAGLTIGRLA